MRGAKAGNECLPEIPDCMLPSVVEFQFSTGGLGFPNGANWNGRRLSLESCIGVYADVGGVVVGQVGRRVLAWDDLTHVTDGCRPFVKYVNPIRD